MTRAKVCCFTGHRPEALFSNAEERQVYELIYAAVEDAVLTDMSSFIVAVVEVAISSLARRLLR